VVFVLHFCTSKAKSRKQGATGSNSLALRQIKPILFTASRLCCFFIMLSYYFAVAPAIESLRLPINYTIQKTTPTPFGEKFQLFLNDALNCFSLALNKALLDKNHLKPFFGKLFR
jgi:hypothetical protein